MQIILFRFVNSTLIERKYLCSRPNACSFHPTICSITENSDLEKACTEFLHSCFMRKTTRDSTAWLNDELLSYGFTYHTNGVRNIDSTQRFLNSSHKIGFNNSQGKGSPRKEHNSWILQGLVHVSSNKWTLACKTIFMFYEDKNISSTKWQFFMLEVIYLTLFMNVFSDNLWEYSPKIK